MGPANGRDVEPGRVGVENQTRRREFFCGAFFFAGVLQILFPRELNVSDDGFRERATDAGAELQLP